MKTYSIWSTEDDIPECVVEGILQPTYKKRAVKMLKVFDAKDYDEALEVFDEEVSKWDSNRDLLAEITKDLENFDISKAKIVNIKSNPKD